MESIFWCPIRSLRKETPLHCQSAMMERYLMGWRPIEYQNVIAHEGYILIAYAVSNKEKKEVLKIKIFDLDKLDMSDYINYVLPRKIRKK